MIIIYNKYIINHINNKIYIITLSSFGEVNIRSKEVL